MTAVSRDMVAVIFTSRRSRSDDAGYSAAATAMENLARIQPGYVDFVAARDPDGFGIAVSYWTDEAAALAWRDHPQHSAVREQGRAIWYDATSVTVANVQRQYDWTRP